MILPSTLHSFSAMSHLNVRQFTGVHQSVPMNLSTIEARHSLAPTRNSRFTSLPPSTSLAILLDRSGP